MLLLSPDKRFYYDPAIPYPHGFSTRLGGVSQAAHLASLNLGYGRGDSDETVDENYRIFYRAVFSEETLDKRVSAGQIHSDILHYADRGGTYPDGDGFYTDREDLILTVKVADCVPILFADTQKRLIAAVHAGWRGTVKGIAAKAVDALVAMGSRRENILVAIGHSIRPCCYEVGEDFYRAVAASRSAGFAESHIRQREGKLFADVAGMNVAILRQAGITESHITRSPLCTACHGDSFFSHRASGGLRGTMVGAIMLPSPYPHTVITKP